ncbi:MAG: glycosyltransferase [Pyrinomonadaceae bacterium]
MKILVLSTCYPKRSEPNHGIFIHRQVRALVDLGAECQVLQPVDWSPPAPLHRMDRAWQNSHLERKDMLAEVEGISVHHPTVFHPRPSRFFPGDYWERVGHSVSRYIERRPVLRSADLLYAHFLCHEGYAGLIATRRLGMPLVAIARGDDVHGWPVRWPDRKAKLAAVLKEADGLLACSRGVARDAAEWAADGLAQPFEVIYNGVDTDRFSPAESEEQKRAARRNLGLPEGKSLLLAIGTTIVEKGWLDLFEALARLREEVADWDLVMAGTPRASEDLDLLAEARARGLGGRVHWLGAIAPPKMSDLYRAADTFVLASHNEGLSNSLLEAMASGLPIVVTDVGGHSEIVDSGVNGYLVPPRDVEALALALRDALTMREASACFGRAARQRALQFGNHQTHAAHLLSYFQEMLRARKALRSGEEKIRTCAEYLAS